MNRNTNNSPTQATAALLLLLVGTALWTMSRVGSPILPASPADVTLVVALVATGLVIKALLERDEPIDTLKTGPTSPMWLPHRLVAQSFFGMGAAADVAQSQPCSTAITQPREIRLDELPPPLAAPVGTAPRRHNRPSNQAPNTKEPSVVNAEQPPTADEGPTQILTVGRGDTYWSIAETHLGDGRNWKTLQQLNLGREVAPDTTLAEKDELRIGWSILIPLAQTPSEKGDTHVD